MSNQKKTYRPDMNLHRPTDRQTDSQTDRDRQTDRQTDRQSDSYIPPELRSQGGLMKHYKNDLEFQWVYQGFKNIFWFMKCYN